MLQFGWQWSQNVHLVNTIKNLNSLLRCLSTMVMQQRRSMTTHCIGLTMLTKHASYAKLCLHGAKNLTFDIFFINYEMVHGRWVKLYFSGLLQEESVDMGFENLLI